MTKTTKEVYTDGFDAGFDEGYKEGYKAGMEEKPREDKLYKEQLRANIISMYDGNESSIKILSESFGITEQEVRGYIKEEEEIRKRGEQ